MDSFRRCLFIVVVLLLAGVAPGLELRPDLTIGDTEALILSMPTSVVVAGDGHIFIVDGDLGHVHECAPDGALLATHGQEGDGPGDVPFMATVALDPDERLVMTGIGGRVDVLERDWTYVASFDRTHPGAIPRSVAVGADGAVVIATADIPNHTALDLYDPEHRYVASCGETYGAGRDLDPREESCYAGGFVDLDADGFVYYLQLAPYDLRVHAPDGTLLRSTSEVGGEFVPAPPRLDFSGEHFRVTYPWQTSGLAVLDDGRVVTSACRRDEGGEHTTLILVHDRELRLLAEARLSGTRSVIGNDAQGRLFLAVNEDGASHVVRCALVP